MEVEDAPELSGCSRRGRAWQHTWAAWIYSLSGGRHLGGARCCSGQSREHLGLVFLGCR